ncbi:MAG TPA: hypothetical protein VJ922_09050 [Actinomycetota bacterium]|nr:hypothetical protein [Actinomycetota bacterium]
MKPARRFAPGWLRLAGTAAAGVLVGHFVGYRIVFPGPQRHGILLETGHTYLSLGIQVAAGLAIVCLASMLAGGYARARAGGFRVPDGRITAARLALLQISAFVGLEFVERLVSGVPFHHLLLPVLIVGAIAQVVIAAIGAALIGLLYRAGAAAARASLPDAAAPESPLRTPVGSELATSGSLEGPQPIRGPPCLLLSTV